MKVVIYFFLFVSIVKTPERLRQFIVWLLLFTFVLAAVVVLQYHQVIEVGNVSKVVENVVDPNTGELRPVDRVRGSGIFRDPNDLCVMLAAMMPLALFLLTDPKSLVSKIFWAVEIGLFAYVVYRTQSRGGMLAVLAGLGAFARMRSGWRCAVLAGVLVLPLLVVLGGRQTDFNIQQGTSQGRIQLWAEWLGAFRESPILGIGRVLPDENAEQEREALDGPYKQVAHNAFLQAYADLGLAGGLFLVAVIVAFWTLWNYRSGVANIEDPEMRRSNPAWWACSRLIPWA